MNSTFSGIELGKRGVVAHSKAINTVGHNVSNAGVEGYSRQRVNLQAMDPLHMPALNRENTAGQVGQGVLSVDVTRVEDRLLENRIVTRAHKEIYWGTRDKYILQVEQVYNEPTELSMRHRMNMFFNSWQELSRNSDSIAIRQTVAANGKQVIDSINNRYQSLKMIRDMIDEDITVTVSHINSLTKNIAEINKEIVRSENVGDNPNDLYDQRDRLVKELAGLVDISTDGQDPDEFGVFTGGRELVQGKISFKMDLVSNPNNEGYSDVVWNENGEDIEIMGGKLQALMELRDDDLRSEIDKIDSMALNFADLVNENHRKAYNLNGENGLNFFNEYAFVNNVDGNFDSNGDGNFDTTRLFRITGFNRLDAKDQIGLSGVITIAGKDDNIEIAYNPTDTVEEVIKRINVSGSEVVARLDSDNRLQLKGAPSASKDNQDFVIRYVEDSGEFLTNYSGILKNSGADGAFSWNRANSVDSLMSENGATYSVAPLTHPAGWLEMNEAIVNDVSKIAAGFGVNGRVAELGDGSAAIAIANIQYEEIMVGRMQNLDRFFADLVADIGSKGRTAEQALENEQQIMKDLGDMKLALTGVNIDEEMANLIKFQHGYSATARFITTFDSMLDIIINRMGV